MKKGIAIVCLLFFTSCASSATKGVNPYNADEKLALIAVDGHELIVEIADTPKTRTRGLSYRKKMGPRDGMLFVMDEPQVVGFWMFETYFDLDIAYMNDLGQIIDVIRMTALTKRVHHSSGPALYALEMPAGWFREKGVGVGAKMEIIELLDDAASF